MEAAGKLYIGFDVGKRDHYASLLLPSQLGPYPRYEKGPVLKVENSRAGFEQLLTAIRKQGQVEVVALLERTGHYGLVLEQFLRENCVTLYHITPKRKYSQRDKTDKKDAMALAVILYNYLELHTPTVDSRQHIWPVIESPAETLRGLIQRRYELQQKDITRRKNQLTSICDQLFPEFVQIYKNPNSPSALSLREQFPTAERVAEASLEALCATQVRTFPGKAKLLKLQELARSTIGTSDERSKVIEQRQLIAELCLDEEHIAELDREIARGIREIREVRILMSFPGCGPLHAATLIAGIGTIARFKTDAKLRSYLGWAPQRDQTGSTRDMNKLKKNGNLLMKRTIFLIVCSAIKSDPHWQALYNRLVERKCAYNDEKECYVGKMKVIGRIAGDMIRIIYVLLKRDYEMLQGLKEGEEPPEPETYKRDRQVALPAILDNLNLPVQRSRIPGERAAEPASDR